MVVVDAESINHPVDSSQVCIVISLFIVCCD